jgi:hypothetical protein
VTDNRVTASRRDLDVDVDLDPRMPAAGLPVAAQQAIELVDTVYGNDDADTSYDQALSLADSHSDLELIMAPGTRATWPTRCGAIRRWPNCWPRPRTWTWSAPGRQPST